MTQRDRIMQDVIEAGHRIVDGQVRGRLVVKIG